MDNNYLEQECALEHCSNKAGDIDDCLYLTTEGWGCGPCLAEVEE